MTRMWHTACCTSLPGEVVIFGGCTSSVLDDDPVMSVNFTSSRDPIPYLWCLTLELSNTSWIMWWTEIVDLALMSILWCDHRKKPSWEFCQYRLLFRILQNEVGYFFSETSLECKGLQHRGHKITVSACRLLTAVHSQLHVIYLQIL